MDRRRKIQWAVGVLGGALAVGLVTLAWRRAAEYDANPRRTGLEAQMMRRKLDAMEDILGALIRGKLQHAEQPITDLESYAATIRTYSATDIYRKYGADFHESLQTLKTAVRNGEQEMAKEATLRLERSCIECHSVARQTD